VGDYTIATTNGERRRRRLGKDFTRENALRTPPAQEWDAPQLLRDALSYLECGFSLIPVVGKQPFVSSWKRYQSVRPPESEVRMWLAQPRVTGIALITGTISSGLAIRDFDTSEAYANWKREHPDLAASLPTVKTKRGYHVYSRAEQPAFHKLRDGEYRADNGHYTLAPPSAHPDGGQYEWVVPLSGELPVVPLSVWGIENDACSRVGRGNVVGGAYSTTGLIGNDCKGGPHYTPEDVIRLTLPTNEGHRNSCLLRLAQGLKFNCGLEFKDMKQWVRKWHERALPVIKTKDWRTTWHEFSAAVPGTTTPLGVHPMWKINLHVDAPDTPPAAKQALAKYQGLDRWERLIRLCVGMADDQGRFFLSTYDAAERLQIHGVKPAVTAWRMLKTLCKDGVLAEEKTGNAHRATRYRLVGR